MYREYAQNAITRFKTVVTRRINSRKEGLSAAQRSAIKYQITKKSCWQITRGGWVLYDFSETLARLGDMAEEFRPVFNCGYSCQLAHDLSYLDVFLDCNWLARAVLKSKKAYTKEV